MVALVEDNSVSFEALIPFLRWSRAEKFRDAVLKSYPDKHSEENNILHIAAEYIQSDPDKGFHVPSTKTRTKDETKDRTEDRTNDQLVDTKGQNMRDKTAEASEANEQIKVLNIKRRRYKTQLQLVLKILERKETLLEAICELEVEPAKGIETDAKTRKTRRGFGTSSQKQSRNKERLDCSAYWYRLLQMERAGLKNAENEDTILKILKDRILHLRDRDTIYTLLYGNSLSNGNDERLYSREHTRDLLTSLDREISLDLTGSASNVSHTKVDLLKFLDRPGLKFESILQYVEVPSNPFNVPLDDKAILKTNADKIQRETKGKDDHLEKALSNREEAKRLSAGMVSHWQDVKEFGYREQENEGNPGIDPPALQGPEKYGCAKDKAGVGRADFIQLFELLARKGVQKIITRKIHDDRNYPHSDESMEYLSKFEIEHWDWIRDDISSNVLQIAASKASALHLYSSGNSSVLNDWASPDGLCRLEEVFFRSTLSHSHVDVTVRQGLESSNRLSRNLDQFEARLKDRHPNKNLTVSSQIVAYVPY